MNQRISELAEQAGLEYNFDPMTWLKYEKFAELIVAECMALCKSMDETDTRYRYVIVTGKQIGRAHV